MNSRKRGAKPLQPHLRYMHTICHTVLTSTVLYGTSTVHFITFFIQHICDTCTCTCMCIFTWGKMQAAKQLKKVLLLLKEREVFRSTQPGTYNVEKKEAAATATVVAAWLVRYPRVKPVGKYCRSRRPIFLRLCLTQAKRTEKNQLNIVPVLLWFFSVRCHTCFCLLLFSTIFFHIHVLQYKTSLLL